MIPTMPSPSPPPVPPGPPAVVQPQIIILPKEVQQTVSPSSVQNIPVIPNVSQDTSPQYEPTSPAYTPDPDLFASGLEKVDPQKEVDKMITIIKEPSLTEKAAPILTENSNEEEKLSEESDIKTVSSN